MVYYYRTVILWVQKTPHSRTRQSEVWKLHCRPHYQRKKWVLVQTTCKGDCPVVIIWSVSRIFFWEDEYQCATIRRVEENWRLRRCTKQCSQRPKIWSRIWNGGCTKVIQLERGAANLRKGSVRMYCQVLNASKCVSEFEKRGNLEQKIIFGSDDVKVALLWIKELEMGGRWKTSMRYKIPKHAHSAAELWDTPTTAPSCTFKKFWLQCQ